MPLDKDAIEAAALGPASASAGGRSASARSIAEMKEALELARGLEQDAAGVNPIRSLKRSKGIPPGALGT